MLNELFLAYLESLRAVQLPSTAVAKLVAAVLNTVLLHSCSLCVKCRVFKSLIQLRSGDRSSFLDRNSV